MSKVDYDKIAEQYEKDREHEQGGPPSGDLKKLVESAGRPVAVLDIGCGTGSWLKDQIGHFRDRGVRWAGVDPSAGMLKLARQKAPEAELHQTGAEAIPFPDATFDFVRTCVAFHHFTDKEKALDEIARVTRPGGWFVLSNIDPYRMPRWQPYAVCPESRALDEIRFWTVERLTEGLQRRGFTVTSWGNWWTGRAPLAKALAAMESRTLSQFAALDDAAYERRLRELRARVAADPGAQIDDETAFVTVFATRD